MRSIFFSLKKRPALVTFAIKERVRKVLIHSLKKKGNVLISDTTLREGEQMPGVSFSPQDKLTIARALEDAGVHSLNAGFPISSREEFESVRLVAQGLRKAVVTALARARKEDIDKAARSLETLSRRKAGVSIFLGTSPLHRKLKLEKTPQEILEITRHSVKYARKYFDVVSFAAEDASRTEPGFLFQVYDEAISAGASTIGFADTTGFATPKTMAAVIQGVNENVKQIQDALLAVHCHNDLGLATANTLAAVAAGANIVQCTVNGIGERAGNAALEEVVMALKVHSEEFGVRVDFDSTKLSFLSRLVAGLTDMPILPHKPIVGDNVFATEAGIHQDGILKAQETYLIFDPQEVGAGDAKLLLGKHTGRHFLQFKLKEAGFDLTEMELKEALDRLRRLADKKDKITDDDLKEIARAVTSRRQEEKGPAG
jgi:2-isopropylmalate synthase